MRVCHPLPVDLKAVSMSLSKRTVVDDLAPVPAGLPRIAVFVAVVNSSLETTLPSIIGVALAKKSSVSSGASSGSLQELRVLDNFAVIRVPH